jgi:putative sterol carrier protein
MLSDLERHLRNSFYPPAAGNIDAVLRLRVGDGELAFRVRHGELDFTVPTGARADATFIFADLETARALLSGEANAFEAFMEGRFRSDGYLMWAFALMAMFRSASLPVTPTE